MQIEDEYRREQVERFNQRLREFEEEQRAYRNLHGLPPIERPPGDTDLANVMTPPYSAFSRLPLDY